MKVSLCYLALLYLMTGALILGTWHDLASQRFVMRWVPLLGLGTLIATYGTWLQWKIERARKRK